MIFNQSKVGSDKELEKINEAAWHILEHTGMRIFSDELLDYVADIGAKVDKTNHIAKFPEKVITKTIPLNKNIDTEEEISVPDKFEFGGIGELNPFFYDYDKKERRRATRKDVIDMIRFAEALPETTTIWPAVTNSEVDPNVNLLDCAELLIANTSRPAGVHSNVPEHIKYFVEIRDILKDYGLNWGIQTSFCLTTPLTLGERIGKIITELLKYKNSWKEGLNISFSSMPIAGGNAPVTVAGCCTLGVAELLGGWLISRSVNPEAKSPGMIFSGTMDMATANACFASPDAILQDSIVFNLFKRLYGVRIPVDVQANCIEAKVPGIQAAYQRTFKHLCLAFVTGRVAPNIGILDNDLTFSPVQAMIDLEFARGIWHFFKGSKIDEETIALKEIERIGFAEKDNFLQSEHTLNYFREELWFPFLLDNSKRKDDKEEERIIEKANKKWKEVLNSYSPPEVNEELLKRVHKVIARAKKEILG